MVTKTFSKLRQTFHNIQIAIYEKHNAKQIRSIQLIQSQWRIYNFKQLWKQKIQLKNQAAIRIQSISRSIYAKRQYQHIRNSILIISRYFRGWYERKYNHASKLQKYKSNMAAAIIQRNLCIYNQRMNLETNLFLLFQTNPMIKQRRQSAILIQSHVRQYLIYQQWNKWTCHWRQIQQQKRKSKKEVKELLAGLQIKAFIRKYHCKQIIEPKKKECIQVKNDSNVFVLPIKTSKPKIKVQKETKSKVYEWLTNYIRLYKPIQIISRNYIYTIVTDPSMFHAKDTLKTGKLHRSNFKIILRR